MELTVKNIEAAKAVLDALAEYDCTVEQSQMILRYVSDRVVTQAPVRGVEFPRYCKAALTKLKEAKACKGENNALK